MAFRQNKKFIDPRYFMNEKTEIIKEEYSKTQGEDPMRTGAGRHRFLENVRELHDHQIEAKLINNKPELELSEQQLNENPAVLAKVVKYLPQIMQLVQMLPEITALIKSMGGGKGSGVGSRSAGGSGGGEWDEENI